MVWNKDDWIAALLIIAIIVVSSIVAIYLLGIRPSIDQVFKFLEN